MNYHFKIHKENNGYWATCLELAGCHAQAESREELVTQMEEALNHYLSEPSDSNHMFPAPKKWGEMKGIQSVPVAPSVALANRIRETRLRNHLTQVQMRDRLGIKHLSQYQRLEDPSRANPEWKTLWRIKRCFPRFRVDDLLAG